MGDGEIDDLLTGMLGEVLLTSSAFHVLIRARCRALEETLQYVRTTGDTTPSTPQAVQQFVAFRTSAWADTYLAEAADDNMAQASAVRQMLGAFFPST